MPAAAPGAAGPSHAWSRPFLRPHLGLPPGGCPDQTGAGDPAALHPPHRGGESPQTRLLRCGYDPSSGFYRAAGATGTDVCGAGAAGALPAPESGADGGAHRYGHGDLRGVLFLRAHPPAPPLAAGDGWSAGGGRGVRPPEPPHCPHCAAHCRYLPVGESDGVGLRHFDPPEAGPGGGWRSRRPSRPSASCLA